MKKYVIVLFLGIVTGVIGFSLLLYFNPLNRSGALSPLSVSQNEVITLNYSAVAGDSLIYTNDGESPIEPYPAKVLQLWEAPIRKSSAMATVLYDSRSQAVGIGVKFSSDSESTDILNGEAIVDSVWHIYLPRRGSLFVYETENYWNYLRDIVIPARLGSGKSWRGLWNGQITSGPGALATALVIGGSGDFTGMESDAVESMSAKAYSAERGPVAQDAVLAVEVRAPESDEAISDP